MLGYVTISHDHSYPWGPICSARDLLIFIWLISYHFYSIDQCLSGEYIGFNKRMDKSGTVYGYNKTELKSILTSSYINYKGEQILSGNFKFKVKKMLCKIGIRSLRKVVHFSSQNIKIEYYLHKTSIFPIMNC